MSAKSIIAATPLTDGERSALLEELEGNGQEIPEENLMEAKELLNKMRDRKEPVAGLVQITHSSREQVSRKPLQDGTRGAERIMKAQDCARRIRNALMGLIEAKARSYSYYSDSGLKIDKRRISRLAVWDTKVFRKKVEDFAFSKLRERYKKWTGNSFDEKDLISFGVANEQGYLTNAGALVADESPIRWSRIFPVHFLYLSRSLEKAKSSTL